MGVVTYILENGKLAQSLAIWKTTYINSLSIIARNFVAGKNKNEIKTVTYPRIKIGPIKMEIKILGIKKFNEKVLKLYIIIGKINICVDTLT